MQKTEGLFLFKAFPSSFSVLKGIFPDPAGGHVNPIYNIIETAHRANRDGQQRQ